jgi:lysophospholipase L1-like esterase
MPALARAIGLPFCHLRGGTSAPTTPINLVYEGDSITATGGSTTNLRSYANQYAGASNLSVSSSTITGAAPSLTARAATCDALIIPGARNVLVVMTGNDMLGAGTAAEETSRLATYLTDRLAAGWTTRVVLSTLPRTAAAAPGFNAKRATANATKATWVGTYCEVFINLDTTTIGQDADASDVAKYADGVHPTDAGNAVILAAVKPELDALLPVYNGGAPSTDLIEHWKLNTNLTQATGTASSWKGLRQVFNLLQATGTKQPAVQGDGSLLFDGTDDYMKALFAWEAIGFTVCLLMKQKTWASADCICDTPTIVGLQYNALLQYTTANGISFYNGAAGTQNNNLALDTWAAVVLGVSAAETLIQVDATTATTDAGLGPNKMGGFLLASIHDIAQYANIQVKEVLLYRGVLDATARAAVRTYFATVP